MLLQGLAGGVSPPPISKTKNPKTELYITRRGAHEEITKLADYVSEVKKIKHPIDKGI